MNAHRVGSPLGLSKPPESQESSESQVSPVQFKQTEIAKAVESVLYPKQYTVSSTDTIADIEKFFGIIGFGPSLLLGVKSLAGKTLVYHNGIVHVQESGTSFAVRPTHNEK